MATTNTPAIFLQATVALASCDSCGAANYTADGKRTSVQLRDLVLAPTPHHSVRIKLCETCVNHVHEVTTRVAVPPVGTRRFRVLVEDVKVGDVLIGHGTVTHVTPGLSWPERVHVETDKGAVSGLIGRSIYTVDRKVEA